jgi:hypothetical protein
MDDRLQETNLTLQAYNQYRTTFPAVEIIGGMLWDTVLFTSAAVNRLQLFNTPRATPDLTNLATPGLLVNNTAFLIRSIRFRTRNNPRSTARAATTNVTTGSYSDLALLLNSGFFRLTIAAKPYAEFPLWFLPSGCGPSGDLGADGNTADPGITLDYATIGVPSQDNAFTLTQPLFISPMVSFFAELQWPAAITLVGGNTLLQLVFDGDLIRPVQ